MRSKAPRNLANLGSSSDGSAPSTATRRKHLRLVPGTAPAAARREENPVLDRATSESGMKLVAKVVAGFARRLPSFVPLDELHAVGALGLADAAQRYDPSKQRSFETFAEWRVKGAILDWLRRADPMTRRARRRRRQVAAAARTLTSRLGRPPSDEELAADIGIEVDELEAYVRQTQPPRFVFVDTAGGDSAPMGAMLGHRLQDQSPSPEDVLLHRERVRSLEVAIDALPARYGTVIALYYAEELTLREIGELLGVTESRISQIHRRALERMRDAIAA